MIFGRLFFIPQTGSSGKFTGYCRFTESLVTDEILDVDYSLATQATEPWRMELYENYNYYVNGDAQAKSFYA